MGRFCQGLKNYLEKGVDRVKAIWYKGICILEFLILGILIAVMSIYTYIGESCEKNMLFEEELHNEKYRIAIYEIVKPIQFSDIQEIGVHISDKKRGSHYNLKIKKQEDMSYELECLDEYALLTVEGQENGKIIYRIYYEDYIR